MSNDLIIDAVRDAQLKIIENDTNPNANRSMTKLVGKSHVSKDEYVNAYMEDFYHYSNVYLLVRLIRDNDLHAEIVDIGREMAEISYEKTFNKGSFVAKIQAERENKSTEITR